MKIKLLGKNLGEIRPLLPDYGLIETDGGDFEVIITYGGDGALLGAEQEYPGVPKFPLRDSATAPTCAKHELRERLRSFVSGNEKLSYLPKVRCSAPGGVLNGINDVFLHSASPVSALRYQVTIDGLMYAPEVVGDGVGLATVHGAGAYYRSITHSMFRVGIGLAFSNSTRAVDHLVLDEKSVVEVLVKRGPGLLTADNSGVKIEVQEGETVTFLQDSRLLAGIYGLEGFMCHDCRLLRHHF